MKKATEPFWASEERAEYARDQKGKFSLRDWRLQRKLIPCLALVWFRLSNRIRSIVLKTFYYLGHLIFLHCVFSDSSNHLPERMDIHIGFICLTFLHCVAVIRPGLAL